MKTPAIVLISKEREEQFTKHKRTISQDAIENSEGELKNGAIALLENRFEKFPRQWSDEICKKMIQKDYKERLIIAGALICAEIDRIQLYVNENK